MFRFNEVADVKEVKRMEGNLPNILKKKDQVFKGPNINKKEKVVLDYSPILKK